MSAHDRGAFGQLLGEAKQLGAGFLSFSVNLITHDDDDCRWIVSGEDADGRGLGSGKSGSGRTGEEALRRLVERLR